MSSKMEKTKQMVIILGRKKEKKEGRKEGRKEGIFQTYIICSIYLYKYYKIVNNAFCNDLKTCVSKLRY